MEPRRVPVTSTRQSSGSGNATADRMAIEAAGRVQNTVQRIVDALHETHAGRHPAEIIDAMQVMWAERVTEAAPPLPGDKAAEYARHISAGNRLVIVPADAGIPPQRVGSYRSHRILAGKAAARTSRPARRLPTSRWWVSSRAR